MLHSLWTLIEILAFSIDQMFKSTSRVDVEVFCTQVQIKDVAQILLQHVMW